MTVFLVEQNAFHALKLAHRGYVMVNGIITHERHRQGAAGAARGPRRLSRRRPALRGTRMPSRASTTRGDNGSGSSCSSPSPWAARRPISRAGPSPRPGGPSGRCPLYMLALAAGVRFFHFALFDEPLLSLPSYAVDLLRSGLCRGLARLPAGAGAPDGARSMAGCIARAGPLGWRRTSSGLISAGAACNSQRTANRRDFAQLSLNHPLRGGARPPCSARQFACRNRETLA